MKPQILVFAGSYREASQWAREQGLGSGNWDYIASADRLRGRITTWNDREFLAGFLTRPDSDQILAMLSVCDAKAQR